MSRSILVTGANGFVGKNLVAELKNQKLGEIYECTRETDPSLLSQWAQKCDFVYHLAGVNRPKNPAEFMTGNYGFTATLLDLLKKTGNKAPILIASSTQALQENPYGQSKKAVEELVTRYGLEEHVRIYVYRMPNLFGKWCRPNYNSVVATFCYNITRDLPITVTDPSVELSFVYIDDLVVEFINALHNRANREKGDFCRIHPEHNLSIGSLAETLHLFRQSRKTLTIPHLKDPMTKKLYSTYLSYLPPTKLSYPLTMHEDHRGSFTEFLRSRDQGQVSVNISKPGVVKGNHWHHTKNEKFLVVYGQGIIRFRRVDDTETIEYPVTGEYLQVIDIPPGYTHNIENTGTETMITIMWANEPFNPEHPDTYYCEV